MQEASRDIVCEKLFQRLRHKASRSKTQRVTRLVRTKISKNYNSNKFDNFANLYPISKKTRLKSLLPPPISAHIFKASKLDINFVQGLQLVETPDSALMVAQAMAFYRQNLEELGQLGTNVLASLGETRDQDYNFQTPIEETHSPTVNEGFQQLHMFECGRQGNQLRTRYLMYPADEFGS